MIAFPARAIASWRSRRTPALAVLAAGAWLFAAALAPRPATGQEGIMPELPKASAEAWVNSAPLSKADFAGKVVLIEIWTST